MARDAEGADERSLLRASDLSVRAHRSSASSRGPCFGFVVAALKWLKDDRWAIVAGVVSATLSAITLVWGFADRARAASTLMPRYVEHHNALRKLFEQSEQGRNIDEAELNAAIDALDETAVVEAEKIKTSNRKLLRSAQRLVLQERGLAPAK
jgi:hypothetical protein